MVDPREDEFVTKRDEYVTRQNDYIAPRGSSSTMWTLILGGLIALGLIFAFSSWDFGPSGTQTSMTEQQAIPPASDNAPAVAPAPGNNGNTAQPSNP